jgi:hypothetical protein
MQVPGSGTYAVTNTLQLRAHCGNIDIEIISLMAYCKTTEAYRFQEKLGFFLGTVNQTKAEKDQFITKIRARYRLAGTVRL